MLFPVLLDAVRRAERFLGPDDDWVEDDRRIVYEAAQRLLGRFYTFTREKGPADYVTTAHANPDVVEVALDVADYQRNLLSSRKYREHHDGGRQWAVGSFVYDPVTTPWQHHVYLFEAPNGGTDVYAHREPSVRLPRRHLDQTTGVHGDPAGIVRAALDNSGIEHGSRSL